MRAIFFPFFFFFPFLLFSSPPSLSRSAEGLCDQVGIDIKRRKIGGNIEGTTALFFFLLPSVFPPLR